MSILTPQEFRDGRWSDKVDGAERARHYCEQLEDGQILVFPETPFPIRPEDRQFLLSVRQSNASYHKNISYRPHEDRIRGVERGGVDIESLRRIMRDYSRNATAFASTFLSPYAGGMHLDYASFRAVEEHGRKMSMKARNDLLHVDAFPTRPTNGDRILRVFTNIHPSQPRGWVTAETFEVLAGKMAVDAGLPAIVRKSRSLPVRIGQAVGGVLRGLGLPVKNRSAYDRFMLSFHDYLKHNEAFQQNCSKTYYDFPPGSTWIVFTDVVSHAVLSGQFALEQTFIVARRSLLRPEKAPVQILESMAGARLTNSASLQPVA